MSITFYKCKVKDYGNGVQQYINYERPIKIGQQGKYNKPRDRMNELYELSEQLADGKKTLQEVEHLIKIGMLQNNHSKKSAVSRAKQKIYDLAQSNNWEWFITLTFSPEKVDRTDYAKCTRLVKLFLDETRRLSNGQFKYLGVPEHHADGISYHFHFLFSGIDDSHFVVADVQDDYEIYNLGSYAYGFSTATRIRDTRKVSGYITKYVTKELDKSIKGKKRYWASRNLTVPLEYVTEQEIDTTMFPYPIWTKEVEIDTPVYKNKIKYEIFNFSLGGQI